LIFEDGRIFLRRVSRVDRFSNAARLVLSILTAVERAQTDGHMIDAKRWLLGLAIGSLASLGVVTGQTPGQAIVSTQPAGTVAGATATTAPSATVAGDVLVAPFKPLGDAGPDWVAKAVQENLVTDLSAARFHPATAEKAFDDNTAAVNAGRVASARFVVVGTIQPGDGLLRFTGQILNVNTGQSVAGITATGSVRDLFALEDSLSQQAIRAIATQATPVAQQQPGAAQPVAVAPVAVVPVAGQNVNPAAAPAVAAGLPGARYQGSALQAYLDANRTPSQDYNTQVQNSRDNSTFGTYNTSPASAYGYGYGYGYPYGYGIGYGGFGFGSIVYSGGYGYGTGGGHYGTGTGGGHHGDGGQNGHH
jgi:TolB-like protein